MAVFKFLEDSDPTCVHLHILSILDDTNKNDDTRPLFTEMIRAYP